MKLKRLSSTLNYLKTLLAVFSEPAKSMRTPQFWVGQIDASLISHMRRESDFAICPYNSQENKNPRLPLFCSVFTEDNQQSLISQETWQLNRVQLKNTCWNQNQVQPPSIAGTTWWVSRKHYFHHSLCYIFLHNAKVKRLHLNYSQSIGK